MEVIDDHKSATAAHERQLRNHMLEIEEVKQKKADEHLLNAHQAALENLSKRMDNKLPENNERAKGDVGESNHAIRSLIIELEDKVESTHHKVVEQARTFDHIDDRFNQVENQVERAMDVLVTEL